MRPWFEEYPDVLEDELRRLEYAGYEYRLDERQRAAGRLVLEVAYPEGDQVHRLEVHFPDFYSRFPFQIIASESFPEGKHKDPYSGLLCLQKDPYTNWNASHDTLAAYLNEQVRDILFIHRNPDKAQGREAPEARQITGQIPYEGRSVVFTGKWRRPQGIDRGDLIIGVDRYLDLKRPDSVLRGAVLEIRDDQGQTLWRIEERIAKRYGDIITARWIYVPAPPKRIGEHILEEALLAWPELGSARYRAGLPDIVGLLFPEEVSDGHYEENWVFVVRRKPLHEVSDRGGRKVQRVTRYPVYQARADRMMREVLQVRVPRLRTLANKHVLLLGLGSIGSIIAWQLARSGIGQLTLVDPDFVHLGNAPRWLMGAGAAGHGKAEYLASLLMREYPYLQTAVSNWRFGDVLSSGEPTGVAFLEKILDGIDLVLDATAEKTVSAFLSDEARKRKIPYLWATGTYGSFGGVVGRIVPGKTTGCWQCFRRKVISKEIDEPATENVAEVQSVGCFHPTFPGTGFDMDHVSLAAVRLAVATLCRGADSGYPDFDWDVAVVDLWNSQGQPILPLWRGYPLTQHPNCTCNDR